MLSDYNKSVISIVAIKNTGKREITFSRECYCHLKEDKKVRMLLYIMSAGI